MELNEARNRIIAAADRLYEAGGKVDFPTVDAVRREARADMNTTSSVMKEWRRMQTATPAAVVVAVPERLQDAMQAALVTVWATAQEIAAEALAAAKAAWETERAEAETLRAELSLAYENQADELAGAQERIDKLDDTGKLLAMELVAVRTELAGAEEQAHMAEARAQEIERRAGELRAELDRSHADVEALRAELVKAGDQLRDEKAANQERVNELAGQVAQANADVVRHDALRSRSDETAGELRAELAGARTDAATAREKAAQMQGELDALRVQSAALFSALKPAAKKVPANAKTAPAAKKGPAK